MSLGDRFCTSRKDRTEDVGGCTQRVQMVWLHFSLAVEKPWLVQCRPLLSSFCMNGVFQPCRGSISDNEVFSSSIQAIFGQEPSLLKACYQVNVVRVMNLNRMAARALCEGCEKPTGLEIW